MIIFYNFIYFMIYSVLGWIYESSICSVVKYKRLINRGYLLGPYCPIYGIGAVLNWILLGNHLSMKSSFMVFVIAMLVSCLIEYFTSYIMEQIFHVTWWDYSEMPFNLNGRICLYGAVLFGTVNVILIKFVQPAMIRFVQYIPKNAIRVSAVLLFSVFLIDVVLTTISMKNLNDHLKMFHDTIREKMDVAFDDMTQCQKYIEDNMLVTKGKLVVVNIQNVSKKMKTGEIRLLEALPDVKSKKYAMVLEKIKKSISKK